MINDVTRLVASSVYKNSILRYKILKISKEKYKAIAESVGLDAMIVLKHSLRAEKINRQYYWILLIPTLIICKLILDMSDYTVDPFNNIFWIGIIYLFSTIYVCYAEASERDYLLQNFKDESYNSLADNLNEKDKKTIDNLVRKSSGNIVCYNGFSPFVGRGIEIGAWSFVVDIDRGVKKFDVDLKPEKFEVEELYNDLDLGIQTLKIGGLSVIDKIFISGDKIRDDRYFLPKLNGFPINNVSEADFDIISKNENSTQRRYKVITVVAWGGDLVFSNFIRLQKTESSLFIESNSYLLPPISDSYRGIEKLRYMEGILEPIGWFLLNVLKTQFLLLFSLYKVASYINQWFTDLIGYKAWQREKSVMRDTEFNYGALDSIRQLVGEYYYKQHFQRLDKEMHHKTIEKRIFNCLGDFLESKGIDTSEFKERETNIINSGIIVNGGNVKADNIVAGEKPTINILAKLRKQNEKRN